MSAGRCCVNTSSLLAFPAETIHQPGVNEGHIINRWMAEKAPRVNQCRPVWRAVLRSDIRSPPPSKNKGGSWLESVSFSRGMQVTEMESGNCDGLHSQALFTSLISPQPCRPSRLVFTRMGQPHRTYVQRHALKASDKEFKKKGGSNIHVGPHWRTVHKDRFVS